jgi:lipopolysaccharide assembly protein A
MQLFIFLALLISIVLVLFAAQNAAMVTLSFLSFHFQGSLALILVIVFAAGFITGVLMTLPSILKKSFALREQRRRVKQLEEGVMKRVDSSQTQDPKPAE